MEYKKGEGTFGIEEKVYVDCNQQKLNVDFFAQSSEMKMPIQLQMKNENSSK